MSMGPMEATSTAPSSSKSTSTADPKRQTTPPQRPETILRPDKNFAKQDLITLTLILHQDANATFQRIADEFHQKTNRKLDPEVFERKIMGRVMREEREKAREEERKKREETNESKMKEMEKEWKRMQRWEEKMERERKKEIARRAHFGV